MSWMNALSLGRQHAQEDRAIADQQRLGKLSAAALTASPEGRNKVLGQVAALDPNAAFGMRETFQREDASAEEATRGRLVNMAKMLAAAPEPMRGGLYSQMVPGLRQMGLQAPDVWQPELMGVVQSLAGVSGEQHRPMVVAPGSALVGPDGQVVFQNAFKPEAPDLGRPVEVPVRGGRRMMIWRNGRLEPLNASAPSASAPQRPKSRVEITPGADPIPPEVLSGFESAMREGRDFRMEVPAGGGAPNGGDFGFIPDAPRARLATADEKRLYGYGESDIIEIDANGLPKPIRVAEAPGAKAPSAETANKVSLYDNALRAANEWRSLVVNSDGTFNDVAARMPQAKALLTQALRAKLRAESGASISAEEISGETDRYMGGLFSSDSTAVQKATALVDDLTNQRAALDPSNMIRPAIPVTASAPAAPAPAQPSQPAAPRAVSADGRTVEWNGSAWVEVPR